MDALAYDLKNMCDRNRDGSHSTQANRHRFLQMAAKQLKGLGYKLPSARSIKPKHVKDLIGLWRGEGVKAGTLKNRMGYMRFWAEKVNKGSIIPRDNLALGIENRKTDQADKGQKLDMAKLAGIKCPKMRMSMRLMSAFGLRMEEALKIRPSMADAGDRLALKASWTKGGKYREIPMHSDKHRELLEEAKELAGGGSLIPDDKSYIQHRKAFEYATLKGGLSNLHGLRHNYAQWRYKQLTGRDCPKLGLKREDMNPAQLRQDRSALFTISHELGHERPDITKVYVG